MAQIQRSDGLNNPLSPNSGLGCTWRDVAKYCDESTAVDSYDDEGVFTITWVDGNDEQFSDPQAALIAVRRMSE